VRVVLLLGVLATALVLMVLAFYTFPLDACEYYSAVTGRSTRYVFPGGCYVRDGADWWTLEEYRGIAAARHVLREGNHGL